MRYFTSKKLDIFIKIPFLVHINSPDYAGFISGRNVPHGIWNFEKSGFYKEAAKTKIFPKSIVETSHVDAPAILGFYHIGSLGTFTQSSGSDFDYWVIIDKKNFSSERYNSLERKLDNILKYAREEYSQEVSFFVMDGKEIKDNCYAPFKGEETLTAPKIFLKEEFYRTFLMIAGKIPLWSVLPVSDTAESALNSKGIASQALSLYDDLIDLGQIDAIPIEDILKGLLWHICKSGSDPVKAVIKATMIFSYGFGQKISKRLLCETIKLGYSEAGIDDYGVDPYKAVFDRILKFHEIEDPKGINLIKNAIFFRLCGYPDVKMPDQDTPKRYLLTRYIRTWNLNKTQVGKLLSYTNWSESEKLLLEKSLVQRLAQMYNYALKEKGKIKIDPKGETEKRNWAILRNKTRERLRRNPDKINECSTYLKRKPVIRLDIMEKELSWELALAMQTGEKIESVHKQPTFGGVLGWILENQLYRRQTASLDIHTQYQVFESTHTAIPADKLYMAFQPLKPLSDAVYEQEPSWSKMMIFLFYREKDIQKAEFLISNTWGELFLEKIDFSLTAQREEKHTQIAEKMHKYADQGVRFFFCQFSQSFDPDIVYQVKKAYNDLNQLKETIVHVRKKPYLDKL